MPAVPTRLPRRSCGARTPALPTAISDVSGFCTSAPTATRSVGALVAGEQQLRLVGDGEVGLAGLQQLERRGRIGRRLERDVEPRPRERAGLLRRVEAGVVGVREVVEHARRNGSVRAAPAGARAGLGLLAAGGEQEDGAASSSGSRRRGVMVLRVRCAASSRRRGARAARRRRRARRRAGRAAAWRRTRARSRAGRWRSAARGRARRRTPAHSANTAPMTATAAAIFTPVKAAGRALGASTSRSGCQRVACSERSSRRASGSASRRPS